MVREELVVDVQGVERSLVVHWGASDALLGASDERDFLMGAGVGVFQTLPLHRDKVWRAIYDLLKRAPFITGDHGIIKVLFGQEQKWKCGPLWK